MASVVSCPACGTRNRVPDSSEGRPKCAACGTDLPWLVDVGDKDFVAVVEHSRLPVLVDFWAPWCGPCRMVSPVVESLATERAGSLKVAKVNSDLAPWVSASHGIQSIPTLLIYVGGREVSRSIGAKPAAQLRQWVDSVLDAHAS